MTSHLHANMKIRDFNDIHKAADTLSRLWGGARPWWRGQACAHWGLAPELFRKREHIYEQSRASLFRTKARTRHMNCPQQEDLAGWLFLMQHYRARTRLLDWTESILIATYFAVVEKEYQNEPGALWGLRASTLNDSQVNRRQILGQDEPVVMPIVKGAFVASEKQEDQPIVAINAHEIDIRMMVQLSKFTIHGNRTELQELPDWEKFLHKFEIPAEAKRQLRSMLDLFGFEESNLFPDLENLAREVNRAVFAVEK